MVESAKFTKIHIPEQPVRFKKLLYSNTLAQIREEMMGSVEEFHFFTDQAQNCITKNDEGEILLSSIIRESNQLYFMKPSIKVSINNKGNAEIPLTSAHTLTEARVELQKLGYRKFSFLFSEFQIEESDEKSTSIRDILTEDSILIKLQVDEAQDSDDDCEIRKIVDDKIIDPPPKEDTPGDTTQPKVNNEEHTESYNVMKGTELIALYPDGALKCMLQLIDSLNLKDILGEESKSSDANIPQDQDIEKILTNLKELLPLEYNLDSQIGEKLFTEIKQLCLSKKWNNAKKKACQLLKETRVLDIQYLKLLLLKVDEAAERVANKDIILFLGETGSGKSTTIHFLAGSKMEAQKLKGINHIGPVKIPNQDAANVKTNPFSASVTKFITPVSITFRKKQVIVLCDSPGFDDSEGLEVDIANGIGVIRAIMKAKSVRPVILLSGKGTGDRFGKIKPIAYLLVGMISNIDEYLETLTYIFTKFSKEEQESLKYRLADVLKTLTIEEESDLAFKSIFEDLQEQTENDDHICLDPLKSNHEDILKKLMKRPSITNPQDRFKFYITQNSEKAITQQVSLHQIYIQKAVKCRNYSLLHHKLDELKFLMVELNKDNIRIVYDDCVSIINSQLNEDFNKAVTIFNLHLIGDLTNNQIEEYVSKMKKYSEFMKLRQDHLGEDSLTDQAFVQNVDYETSQLAIVCNKADIDSIEAKKILDKLRMIYPYFVKVQDFYTECLNLKVNDIEKHTIDYQHALESNNVEKSLDILKKIYRATVSLEKHIEQHNAQRIGSNLNQMCLQHLQKLNNKIEIIFSKDDISSNEVGEASKILTNIQDYSEQYKSQKIIKPQEIQRIYQACLSAAENHFQKLNNSLLEILEKNEMNCFKIIEPLVLKMHEIRSNISVLDISTSQKFYQTLEQVFGKIMDLKKDIEHQIDQSFDNNQQKYQKLSVAIGYAQNATWVDYFRPGLINQQLDIIIKKLKSRADYLYDRILNTHSDLNNFEDLEVIINDTFEIEQMMSLQNLEEVSFSEQYKKCYDYLSSQIQSITEEIEITAGLSVVHKVVDKQDEELKANETAGEIFQPFQINLVESALLFFQEFSEIKYQKIQGEFQKIKKVVLDKKVHFKNHMLKQIEAIKQNADMLFNKIKHYNGNESLDLFQNARQLEQAFQTFREIYGTKLFKDLFDPKQGLLLKWSQELDEYSNDLSEEVGAFQANLLSGDFSNKLMIMKALIRVDEFNEAKQGSKFRDLYKTSSKMYYDKTPDAQKEVIELIKSNKFSQVSVSLTNLQAKKDDQSRLILQNFNTVLRNAVDDLAEETMNQANSIQIKENFTQENLIKIMKNIKDIKSSKDLQDFIGDKIDVSKIVIMLEAIIRKHYCSQLDAIINEIETYHFIDADRNFFHIKSLQSIVQLNDKEITDKFLKIEIQQKDIFEKLVQKFNKLELKKLSLNKPRDVLQRLKAGERFPQYKLTIDKLEEVILNKFKEEIDKVDNIQGLQMKLDKLSMITSYTKCLPQDLAEMLAEDISQMKLKYEYEDKNWSQCLQMAISSKDFPEIRNLMNNARKFCNQQQEFEIKKFLVNEFKTSISAIDAELIKGFTEKCILGIEVLNNNMELFAKYYPSDNIAGFNGLQSRINKLYLSTLMQLENIFRKLDDDSDSQASLDLYELQSKDDNTSFNSTQNTKSNLHQFIQLRINYESVTLNFIPKFDAAFIDKLQKISKCIKEQGAQFDRGLENSDFTVLRDNLKIMKRWIPFISKTQDIASFFKKENFNQEIPVLEGRSFDSMQKQVYVVYEKLEKTLIVNCSCLINQQTMENQKSREKFYKDLSQDISNFGKAICLQDLLQNKDQGIDQYGITDSINRVWKKLSSSIEEIKKKLLNFQDSTKNNPKELQEFNHYYKNLKQIQLYMDDFEPTEQIIPINEIDDKFKQNIQKIFSEAQTHIQDYQVLAKALVQLKQFGDFIEDFSENVDDNIVQILGTIQKKGQVGIAKIGILLGANPIGQTILQEYKIFSGFATSIFNQKTSKHDIEYVMSNIDGDKLEKKDLTNRYTAFKKSYELKVKEGLVIQEGQTIDDKIQQMIAEISMKFNKQPNDSLLKWLGPLKDSLVEMIASVFALWTIMNSENFLNAQGVDNQQSYLFCPHPAQVISIFRLVGLGVEKGGLPNQLVQIGTGEGKSVTLAITAVIFSLLGFEVSCACYSEYLCQRDLQAFVALFDALKLKQYIHYGTFNQICERVLNSDFNIRETVTNMVSTNSQVIKNSLDLDEKRLNILLIDEVDVFFSKNFYGNTYTPQATLKDPTITNLISYIWQNKDTCDTMNKIKSQQVYIDCIQRFQGWEFIIEEAVKDILSAVKNFNSQHDYVVVNDKIGYKEFDNIHFNVTYGYKTLFAYFHEHQNNKISEASLKEKIAIGINCGSYSYAEIPNKFKYIMGVTGTLRNLSDTEKDIIEKDYKILQNTYMPSVFGANNLKFSEQDDVLIENSSDFFNRIVKEIEKKIKDQRAVFVFFESTQLLREFYDSKQLANLKQDVQILTEEFHLKEKDRIVKQATNSGSITLFSRCFGRGTDFIQRDEKVKSQGGVHVIQTFLSEQVSEEIQIKGRTARQGDEGSYMLILLDQELEKFGVKAQDLNDLMNNQKSSYKFLDGKRKDYFRDYYKDTKINAINAMQTHKLGDEFLKNILDKELVKLKASLLSYNKGVQGLSVSKTVCIMDATGSMSGFLMKAKQTVQTMFERAQQILTDNNYDPNCFQLQYAAYRNYNSSANLLLQVSPWTTKPQDLKTFLDTVEVSGGMGNEAVEVGLWHAREEDTIEPITQVILIGDMPPNTLQEFKSRKNATWSITKFSQGKHYQDEVQYFINRKVPIHAFYLCNSAQKVFSEIASQTKGNCTALDIQAHDAAEKLTGIVTSEILRDIGNQNGVGNKLVDAYKRAFN